MNPDRYRTSLESFINRWDLVPDGTPIVTHASCLLPAERDGQPVILKTSTQPDELRGFALLDWWAGHGAIRVLECAPHTILMERATSFDSLIRMSESGRDDEAVAIICTVLDRLHRAGCGDHPPLLFLRKWFESLFETTDSRSFVVHGRQLAAELLMTGQQWAVLHGDMHHGNIVQIASGDWRAIDPQALLGPREYDYANLFRNPSLTIAANPDRFSARLALVEMLADIDQRTMLKWIVSLCALSASWGDETTLDEDTDRVIAELALEYLDSMG